MNLDIFKNNLKNKSITDNSFHFSLSEKMRWLATYWPVHLDIKAEKSGQKHFQLATQGQCVSCFCLNISAFLCFGIIADGMGISLQGYLFNKL